MTQREMNEGLAMSSIIGNTIGWLERRCSELREVSEEREFAGFEGNPFREEDLASAVSAARRCAKRYGFGHRADDMEIFAECEAERIKTSSEIDELRAVENEGRNEAMRSALYGCRRAFGKPLGDHWAKRYGTDDLCGWDSVEELISYC